MTDAATTPALPAADPVHDAPRWFRTALADVPERRDTEVDGVRVHLRCWGEPGRPGIVFVHGGAAHSGWWDHVAPFFAAGRRVVALDLTGHGDSGHRTVYDMTAWAREVVAAGAAGEIGGKPFVVGHSMGGWVAAATGARHGSDVAGIVVVDSPLNDQAPEEAERARRLRRGRRVHPDRASALARFRTLPEQEVLLPYVRRHIAEGSIRPVDGGWAWKFDVHRFAERLLLRDLLPEITCRVAFLRSEHGLVPPPMAEEISALLGHRAPMVELPDAGHHPMLDQPLPLVAALRVLVRQWELDGGSR